MPDKGQKRTYIVDHHRITFRPRYRPFGMEILAGVTELSIFVERRLWKRMLETVDARTTLICFECLKNKCQMLFWTWRYGRRGKHRFVAISDDGDALSGNEYALSNEYSRYGTQSASHI